MFHFCTIDGKTIQSLDVSHLHLQINVDLQCQKIGSFIRLLYQVSFDCSSLSRRIYPIVLHVVRFVVMYRKNVRIVEGTHS